MFIGKYLCNSLPPQLLPALCRGGGGGRSPLYPPLPGIVLAFQGIAAATTGAQEAEAAAPHVPQDPLCLPGVRLNLQPELP